MYRSNDPSRVAVGKQLGEGLKTNVEPVGTNQIIDDALLDT